MLAAYPQRLLLVAPSSTSSSSAKGNLLPLPQGGAEHLLGAHDVGLDRLHRVLDDQLHTHGRRQMDDHVRFGGHAFEHNLIGDAGTGEAKIGVVEKARDVVEGSGREIVDCEHPPAVGQNGAGEVRADEPGAPGDQKCSTVRRWHW